MPQITFGIFAKTIYEQMESPDATNLVRGLLSFITDNGVKNTSGKPYKFAPKECLEFFNGEADLYANLKSGVKKPKVFNAIDDGIGNFIYDLVSEGNQETLGINLISLVNQDETMSESLRNEIVENDPSSDWDIIASKVYVYSVGNNNKTNPKVLKTASTKSLSKNVDALIDMLQKMPKPIEVVVPNELEDKELTYVTAILEAFAEDAGVKVITKEELKTNPAYSQYISKFNRSRKDFYHAETIRESLKDTKLSSERDYFQELEDETYDSIIDVVEDKYTNSYERMNSVLKHITLVELNSLIAKVPGWIKTEEKKGMCHELVNDGKIGWKNE